MEKTFKNRNGEIAEGAEVGFLMENQTMWGGDNRGVLIRDGEQWKIRTKRSGDIGIGGYLEAYPNTLYEISPPPGA